MKKTTKSIILGLLTGLISISGVLAQDSSLQTTEMVDEIRTMTIIKSGWFSKDTLVIKYREMSGEILSVKDKGKVIPAEKFHKYQARVNNVIKTTVWNETLQEMEEIRTKIRNPKLSNIEKLAVLETIFEKPSEPTELGKPAMPAIPASPVEPGIEDFEILDDLALEYLKYKLNEELNLSKNAPMMMKISRDTFIIDGTELPPAAAKQWLSFYEIHVGRKLEKGETISVYFD
ncbi:hypothetical protein HQ531_07725 [bacterium]|nr:hypothetical protein [bacterium]